VDALEVELLVEPPIPTTVPPVILTPNSAIFHCIDYPFENKRAYIYLLFDNMRSKENVYFVSPIKIAQIGSGSLSQQTKKQEKLIKELHFRKEGIEKEILSTGIGDSFEGKVQYEIFVPKGTQVMYATPFSACGEMGINGIWEKRM
jgi:hypothetical protein